MWRHSFVLTCALVAVACSSQEPSVPAERRPAVQVPPLPSPRHGHRVERVGDELYGFGGFDDASSADDRGSRDTLRLKLGDSAWTRAASMQAEHAFFGSGVIDGQVYAVGESIERYDRAADRWETVAPAGSMPRSHFGCAVLGRRIVVLGGFPAQLGGALAFDVDTRALIDLPQPPGFEIGDHFHMLVELGGALHAIGGIDSEPSFEITAQHWVLEGEHWVAAPPPPRPTWAKFTVQQRVGARFYVFDEEGGLCYDAASASWSEPAAPGVMLVMPASVELDGRIHVLGGEFPARERALRVYDPARDAWERSGAPTPARP